MLWQTSKTTSSGTVIEKKHLNKYTVRGVGTISENWLSLRFVSAKLRSNMMWRYDVKLAWVASRYSRIHALILSNENNKNSLSSSTIFFTENDSTIQLLRAFRPAFYQLGFLMLRLFDICFICTTPQDVKHKRFKEMCPLSFSHFCSYEGEKTQAVKFDSIGCQVPAFCKVFTWQSLVLCYIYMSLVQQNTYFRCCAACLLKNQLFVYSTDGTASCVLSLTVKWRR